MTSFESFSGIGVYEMPSAAGREVKRIMAEAGGDRLKADKIALTKLHELNFITESELPLLNRICELGHAATGGKHDAAKAYHEVKKAYEELLVKGNASPVALAYASGAVGSYVSADGDNAVSNAVVYKKAGGNWQGTLAGAGGVIGGYFGGSGGAALGAAIGSVVGKILWMSADSTRLRAGAVAASSCAPPRSRQMSDSPFMMSTWYTKRQWTPQSVRGPSEPAKEMEPGTGGGRRFPV